MPYRLCPIIRKPVLTLSFTRLNLSDNLVNRLSSPSQIVSAAQPPRLLDQLRDRLRLRHYSLGTEQTYVNWVYESSTFGTRVDVPVGKDSGDCWPREWCGRSASQDAEPVGEAAVEERKVGEAQRLVVIHEGLLDRAIEASVWRSSWASWGTCTSAGCRAP
jgi:hypothetical protein